VAILTGDAHGDRLIFYGIKDSNGDVTQIQTMQYYMPGESKPWNIEVDESGRPTRIATHEGSVYTFTYMDDKLTVDSNDNAGNLYSEDFSLIDVDLPLVDNSLLQTANEESVYSPLEDSIVTVEIVKGGLKTHMENPITKTDLGNVNVDEVIIVASNHEWNIPYTQVEKGEYRFTVTHRTVDLNVLTAQCVAKYQTRSNVLGVVGAVAGIIGLLIAAKYLAASSFFTWAFGISGSVWGVTALAVPTGSWNCKDLLRKGLVDMGVGKQSVEVNTLWREIPGRHKIEYDLFNLTDDINIDRSFNIIFSYPVIPGFISVSTIPANPKVGETYELNVQAILPQGGSIEWGWIREDDRDSGQWTNSSNDIEVSKRFGPIPAAGEEVLDVFEP